MLMIRLARAGKRGHATFRIVVAERARATRGKAVETLGSYDPHTDAVRIRAERVRHWLARGARVSPTVHNLLVDEKIITGEKRRAWKPKRKGGAPAGGPESGAATESSREEPALAGEKTEDATP